MLQNKTVHSILQRGRNAYQPGGGGGWGGHIFLIYIAMLINLHNYT